jgi:hypothetical protein
MAPKNNPFDTYDAPFKQEGHQGIGTFNAVPTSDGKQQQKRQEQVSSGDIVLELPNHLFIPSTAQSINIMRLADVSPGTTDLIVFPGPSYKILRGTKIKFIGYCIFSDALSFNLVNFVPTLDGKRLFPFHGDPQSNYKIGLGLGPDFGNENLIPCQLDMQVGQVLKWTFTNSDVVTVAAGVRMVGYVDSSIITTPGRVGG